MFEGEVFVMVYVSVDLFVFLSVIDIFGNVVFEVMVLGLLLIVSNKGGLCELVVFGCIGLVIEFFEGLMVIVIWCLVMLLMLCWLMFQCV